MTITIDVSPETLRRLQISASIKGKNVENVVEQIIERSVPTLDEAAAPFREAIADTGISETEVEDFFDEVLSEVRAEKTTWKSMIEAIFDTNILLQATASIHGPAAACWRLAEERKIRVFLTEGVLGELENVLNRPKVRRQFPQMTDQQVSRVLAAYRSYSSLVAKPPAEFQLSRDEDDAKFIDLAIFTGATHIVTRDRDLLDLRNDSAFSLQFPELKIVTPVGFLEIVRAI